MVAASTEADEQAERFYIGDSDSNSERNSNDLGIGGCDKGKLLAGKGLEQQ